MDGNEISKSNQIRLEMCFPLCTLIVEIRITMASAKSSRLAQVVGVDLPILLLASDCAFLIRSFVAFVAGGGEQALHFVRGGC